MIPVTLQLRNFLSYGEDVPPLDFNEFDVACLSGSNGHGKSAILDAMTWALWGEARKAAGEKSPSDGLLRIGTPEMQVELVFDLEGDRYRVIRNYHRKTRRIRLDFHVFDENSHTYKSLSERTIGDTQKKITATLRMEYDTFINSAFILQGRVDEFTKKTPHKRKEILAEILDLSHYERLADLAKDRYKSANARQQGIEEQCKTIEEELQHQPEYAQKLAQVQQRLVEIDADVQTHETRRRTLEQQQADLRGKQAQFQDRTRQKKTLQEEASKLEEKTLRQQKQIAKVQELLAQESQILHAYQRYLDLQQQQERCEQQFRELSTCHKEQNELEKAIQQARTQIEKEQSAWQAKQAQEQQTLQEAQHVLQQAQAIEQGFHELQQARKQDEAWEETRSTVDALEREQRTLEKVVDQQKNQLSVELQSAMRYAAELQSLADKQPVREQEVQDCQAQVLRLESLEQERERNKEIGTECRARQDQLQAEQMRLQEQLQEAEEKLDLLLRSDTPQCPLCASDLAGQKKVDIEAHFRQEIQQIQAKGQELTRTIAEQASHLDRLRSQYAQLERQIKQLQPARERLLQAQNAFQESVNASEQLRARQPQIASLQARIEQNDYARAEHQRLAELQQKLLALAYNVKTHKALKQRLKTLQKFEGEYSRLETVRERQRHSLAALPAIEQELARLQALLDQRDYAPSEHKQLQDVLVRIAAIGYDEREHQRIQQEFRQLQHAPIHKAELEQAGKSLEVLQQGLSELRMEYEHKTASLADMDRQIAALEEELQGFAALEDELQQATTQLIALKRERDELLQARGTYENKHEHCQRLRVEWEQKQAEIQRTRKDCDIYGHLVQVFGKDGIQAYLIENAVPEIEDEANKILGRLTDNRTHITIESVKNLHSGGVKETLDIKISDELGTRSYEMYSGGEAFRVDFAIRIALSKLLAKRAGTKLKTLVIDEGFGTQDAYGLEQLVEAIKTISSDFEKILVITHLEALKNAFPVRIEVEKYPDIGSQYQIVH
ncbi:SMC domain protein [Candidatus Vecturithrix granuli]|uniref:SMC domain protein n=1 Tax=Vecturithrix granuli TaxID=1499967 RepID=A0A081BX63_VECG1|nr:SMC domain protein [Candidatus Vecturithrix granuli]